MHISYIYWSIHIYKSLIYLVYINIANWCINILSWKTSLWCPIVSVSNQILKLHDNDMMDLFTCLHRPSRNKTAVKRPLPNPGLMWDQLRWRHVTVFTWVSACWIVKVLSHMELVFAAWVVRANWTISWSIKLLSGFCMGQYPPGIHSAVT